MKERLRELGIRNTELSQYMRISRPSLYKYLGLYESGDKKNIPENVLRCFKFIDKHKNLSKEQIISYVLYEFSDTQASDRKEALRQYLMNNSENDQKIRLMYLLISSDIFLSSSSEIVGSLSAKISCKRCFKRSRYIALSAFCMGTLVYQCPRKGLYGLQLRALNPYRAGFGIP